MAPAWNLVVRMGHPNGVHFDTSFDHIEYPCTPGRGGVLSGAPWVVVDGVGEPKFIFSTFSRFGAFVFSHFYRNPRRFRLILAARGAGASTDLNEGLG